MISKFIKNSTKIFLTTRKFSSLIVFLGHLSIGITFLVLAIECYKYPGFISKHFFFPPQLYLLISLLILKLIDLAGFKLSKLLYFINWLVTIILLIFYLILAYLEGQNYPNYVFSHYHINIDVLFYIFIYSLLIRFVGLIEINTQSRNRVSGLISSFRNLLKSIEKKNMQEKIIVMFRGSIIKEVLFQTLISILLILFLISNLSKDLDYIVPYSIKIVRSLNSSYDQKMSETWGIYYDYINFVRNHTDESVSLAIPPFKGAWTTVGSFWLDNYFLFPRKLYQLQDEESVPEGTDYIMLAKGSWPSPEWEYGWPKVKINNVDILYFEKGIFNETWKENVTYVPEDNVNNWGLIRVRKQ